MITPPIVIYEANYKSDKVEDLRTITTDMQQIVLFVRDTYLTAIVNCWVDGNCVVTMEIRSPKEKKEK